MDALEYLGRVTGSMIGLGAPSDIQFHSYTLPSPLGRRIPAAPVRRRMTVMRALANFWSTCSRPEPVA